MSNILLSSTMLRSSPIATSLSSGALSSMQASLSLSPAAAAVLASTAFAPSASATTAAFISPVNAGLMPPRSVVSTASKNPRMPRPSFVVTPSPSFEGLPGGPNSSSSPLGSSSADATGAPAVIPTDPTFVPSTKSLRRALGIPDDGRRPRRNRTPGVVPRVVGHRGALYDELENTLEGFQRCAELGCDAVELDVFCLKDSTLVVFHGSGTDEHPGDLHEYCGVSGSILDLTYEQTQELAFNAHYEEFACPPDKIRKGRIPTLEQVLLGLKPTKTHVKIELKGPGVVEPVLELVERLDMVGQCEFSSFDLDRLRQLRSLRPQVDDLGRHVYKTGALFDDLPEDFIQQALAVGASEVHLRYDLCTYDRVNAIHDAGMDSMVWFRGPVGMKSDVANKYWDIGNEDERCYQVLLDTGVSQLCVNKPDVLLRLLQRQETAVQEDFAARDIVATTEFMDAELELPTGPQSIPLIVDDYESS